MLSIIIPVFNESAVLETLYTRLHQTASNLQQEYEYIFINDGSQDDSLEKLLAIKAADPHVKIINFSRNFGHQIAISAGLDHCKGDAAVILDADLKDPPELIPEFIKKWHEGHDVVYAIRKQRKGESLFKRIACKLFYKILRGLTNLDVPLDTGDFRLLSRRVINHLTAMEEKHRYIRGLSSWIGFKQTGIEYVRPARYAGKTKYSTGKLFTLAWEGVTSLSLKPLKMATYFGIFFSGLSIIYLGRILYVRLFSDHYIQGWTSLMAVMLLLGSIQLLSLGIIGEYIGRTTEETRKRPLYIVKNVYE